jgi:predicted permease
MQRLLRRLRYWLTRRRREAELLEEIEGHRALAQDALERSGVPAPEAASAARRALGNELLAREDARAVWIAPRLDSLWQDARYAVRTLRANAAFTLCAVLTLSLGIGVNAGMFSVVNAVLLRPLPYEDASRLALLWTADARRGLREQPVAYANFQDFRAQGRSFADMALFMGNAGVLTGAAPERFQGAFASANLFPLLGVLPSLGRTFTPEEEQRGEHVAVLSHGLWRRRFGGAPDAIGKSFEIDGDTNSWKRGPRTVRVIGVMPAGFYFPDKHTQLWEPATVYWRWQNESSDRFTANARRWRVIGRLRAAATLQGAQAEITSIGARLARAYPSSDPEFSGFGLSVVPLLEQVTGRKLQLALWLLLGAVAFVLLIACANLASLLLARGAARQRELSVRASLGAGRGRLLRQLLVESALLAAAGGALGLWLAGAAARTLAASAPPGIPRLDELQVDANVLGFTAAVTLFAGLAFGLLPAWRLSHADPQASLKEGGSSGSRGRSLRRTHGLLVMVESAGAVVLLAGAALLVRSLLSVQAVEPGFRPEGVLALRVSLAPGLKPEREQPGDTGMAMYTLRESLFHTIAARVSALPGVRSVGAISSLLLRGESDEAITIEGRPEAPQAQKGGQLAATDVSPGLFRTLGVPLLRGRHFTRADAQLKICLFFTKSACPLPVSAAGGRKPAEAVVVNQAFATHYFPDEDPLGKRFYIGRAAGKHYTYEIVGVVGNMRRQGLEQQPIPEWFGQLTPQTAELLVRVDGDPLLLSAAVRDVVRSVDKHVMVLSVSSVERQLADLLAARRFHTVLLVLFAAGALALAALGIYGVVRYAVAQRTREIGVRIALGADAGRVRRLLLLDGLRPPLAGLAVGLLGAFALRRVTAHLLFQVSEDDPLTYVAVAAALAGVAVLACFLPARRALRVDPVQALRCE